MKQYHLEISLFLLLLIIHTANAFPRYQAVIGILSTPSDFPEDYDPATTSYIRDTYPSYIQDAGGIPVYVPYDLPDVQLFELLDSVHGIVLPGGDAQYWVDNQETGKRDFSNFMKQMQKVIQYAQNKHKDGIHYPVFGICQGMEVSIMSLTNDPYILDTYVNSFEHGTLDITETGRNSLMFANIASTDVDFLREHGTLFYNHVFGFNLSSFDDYPQIKEDFKITAVSFDTADKKFVAAMEAKSWPLYLVMFHPERVLWESETGRVNHRLEVVDFVKRLARFFTNDARRNTRLRSANRRWENWTFSNLNAVKVDMNGDSVGIYVSRRGSLLNSKNGVY